MACARGAILSTVIRLNIAKNHTADLNCAATPVAPGRPSPFNRAKRVNRKLPAGNISGAVRLLTDKECIAAASPEVLRKLTGLHPPDVAVVTERRSPLSQSFPEVTADEIAECIRTLPNGSAGEPDGMRPGYLKKLLSAREQSNGALLRALSHLIGLMLKGKVFDAIVSTSYGANLFPLRKESGGMGPIAVGCTLRRIVPKVVVKRSLHLSSFLRPTKLSFSTKNGCKAAVHVARHYIKQRQSSRQVHAFLKGDIKNAFNCLVRSVLLASSQQHLLLYQPFVERCYGIVSYLLCEENVVLSRCGIQQDDPLGPLLYCISTVEAHRNLVSELTKSNLDDDHVIGGSFEGVLRDFIRLGKELGATGLGVNVLKCEVLSFGGSEEEQASAYSQL